jgi:hypothetical protein
MPTRAAAVRELLRFGLAAIGVDSGRGVKSSEYGVFSRGPDGHRLARNSSGQNDPSGHEPARRSTTERSPHPMVLGQTCTEWYRLAGSVETQAAALLGMTGTAKGAPMSIATPPQQTHPRDLAVAAIRQAHREIELADAPLPQYDETAGGERNPARGRFDKPSQAVRLPPAASRGRLWSLMGLLASACIAVAAFAWQSSHEEAPDPISTSSVAAGSEATTDAGFPLPSSQPRVTVQRAAQVTPLVAAAAGDPAPSIQTVAHEVADAERAIDELRTEQAKMIRDNAELTDRLKAAQDAARQAAALVEDLKTAQTQMARQNADLAQDLKAAQAQMTRDNADFAERLKSGQEQMARLADQLKASQDQITRLVASEQKPRPRKVASAPPSPNAVRKPAPQARAQTQDPRRLQPKPQVSGQQ